LAWKPPKKSIFKLADDDQGAENEEEALANPGMSGPGEERPKDDVEQTPPELQKE
jgi:hypothetical protein